MTIRLASALLAAPLAALAPQAAAQCDSARSDDQLSGAVIGALLGAGLGAAVGNNVGSDEVWRGRGYRYGHGYGYGGFYDDPFLRRGWHARHRHPFPGGYGHRRGEIVRRDRSGQVVAGTLIGGIGGGLAGAHLATRGQDCEDRTREYEGFADPIAPPTRSPYGEGWNEADPADASVREESFRSDDDDFDRAARPAPLSRSHCITVVAPDADGRSRTQTACRESSASPYRIIPAL